MTRILILTASAVMYGIAGTSVAQSAHEASEKPVDTKISMVQDAPKAPPTAPPKAAPKAPDAGKYTGFPELVRANREAFVKLVKKRNELRSQSPAQDSTFKEYRELEAAYQKVSARVSEFMGQKRWTDEDRAAMTTILTEELTKAVS